MAAPATYDSFEVPFALLVSYSPSRLSGRRYVEMTHLLARPSELEQHSTRAINDDLHFWSPRLGSDWILQWGILGNRYIANAGESTNSLFASRSAIFVESMSSIEFSCLFLMISGMSLVRFLY